MNALVCLLRERFSGRAALSVLVAAAVIGGGSTVGYWHARAIQFQAEQLGAAHAPLARMFAEVQFAHAKEVAALEQVHQKAMALHQEQSDRAIGQWSRTIGQLRQLGEEITRMLADAERIDRTANKLWLEYESLIEPLSELRLEHDRFILHAETVARLVEEQRWSELPDTGPDGERLASVVGHKIDRVLLSARSAETETADATRFHQSILLWNTIVLATLAGGALALLVSPRKTRHAEKSPPVASNETPATDLNGSPSQEDDGIPSKNRTSDVPSRLDGRRVLVVDDGPANQRMFESMLKKAGAEVQLASHGHQAIDCVNQSKLNGTPFDTILMDLDMPLLDGMGATAQLREDGCDTPIIAVTASEHKANREECLSSGFDDFYTKPVSRDKLVAAIRRQIQRVAEQDPVENSSQMI